MPNVHTRIPAVINRLEVDDDHRRHPPNNLADVVGGHHQRRAIDEASAAAIHDRHLRPMACDRLLDLVAPNCVSGNVDVADDKATDGASICATSPLPCWLPVRVM